MKVPRYHQSAPGRPVTRKAKLAWTTALASALVLSGAEPQTLQLTLKQALERALDQNPQVHRSVLALAQSQEEFYFALPYDKMDLCLWGLNHGVGPAEVAAAIGGLQSQVEAVYRDIEAKRRATAYQHTRPLLVEAVKEIHAVET